MIKTKALGLTLSAAMIVSLAGLTGCGNPNDGNNNGTTSTNNISTKNNGRVGTYSANNNNNNNNNNGTQHDLTNLKYSQTLSSKVSNVKGVRDAHVFVANNKAFVALSLDNQNGQNGIQNRTNGTNGSMTQMNTGKTPAPTLNGTTRNRTNDGTYGTTGTGSMGLLRQMTTPTRTNTNNPSTTHPSGTNSQAPLDNNTGMGRGTLDGNFTTNNINGTNRTITGRYGGNVNNNVTNANSVPQDVREAVSSKIRSAAPSCDQVYVSADPDFFNQSAGFSNNNGNVNGNTNGNGNANGNGTPGGIVNDVTNATGNIAHDIGAYINRLFPMNANYDGTNRDGNMNYNTRTNR
ncbi:YhcN/YlaJ family sporulation lipoprotein [Paenibacillus faecalis]|uniref:YhcN/YlaJ family sporulation lipoprotein n=1 Tax=Paenibacillus faecalis TaxID=2079532 RepID=UPI000D10E469|nr:YhcN/YlaJ family sporulation lipoprotein [Paenibacillus faecalis]